MRRLYIPFSHLFPSLKNKNMRIAMNKQLEPSKNKQQLLTCMRIAATIAHKPAVSSSTIPQDQPQR